MGTLPFVSLDLESPLLSPGNLAPSPVVGSMCFPEPGTERLLLPHPDMTEWVPRIVEEAPLIIGANIPFDLGVLVAHGYVDVKAVFKAFEEGRVYDIQTAQALDAIAGGHLYQDPRTGAPLRGKNGKPGRYSLETCVDLVLGRKDAKANDFWRMRYAMLKDVPLADWPAEVKQYPLDDVRNTMDVALVQLAMEPSSTSPTGAVRLPGEPTGHRNLHDLKRQMRAAWCLHLAAMWGLRTDPARVAEFEAEATARQGERVKRFTGIFLRADGSEEQARVKRAAATAYGADGVCPTCGGTGKVPSPKTGKPIACKVDANGLGCDGTGLNLATAPMLPRTDTNGVKTNRDTLMESGDETLIAYAEAGEKDYVDFLKAGVSWPINPRHNVLVESGRTSSDLQQLPKIGGVREAFIAIFNSVDFAALELCTWAQVLLWIFGTSKMAEMINESGDPGALHTALGGKLLGISFEEMKKRVKGGDKIAKDFRHAAKAGNFGFPGGMGPVKFVLSKRDRKEGMTTTPDGEITYAGIRFCILMSGALRCGLEKSTQWGNSREPHAPVCVRCVECAHDLRQQWFDQWPEAKPYFQHINAIVEGDGAIEQYVSRRLRGGVNFTSAANGYFQALAADGAKDAMWRVTQEAFCDESSPMYGMKIANFVHDEVVGDLGLIEEERWHEAAHRQAEVMRATMQRWTPHVTISCEPALMRRLSKDAVAAFDRAGRLVPWEDACKACLFPEKKGVTHTNDRFCRDGLAAPRAA